MPRPPFPQKPIALWVQYACQVIGTQWQRSHG